MAKNKTKEERKIEIMDATLEVFVKKGYAESRIDDIVQLSGLSKGAIYHHYSSKDELFLSLIDHWEMNFFPDFHGRLENGVSASDLLRGFAEEIIKEFTKRRYIFLAELEFWSLANKNEKVRERIKILYKHLLDLFKTVILRGVESGEFRKLNPDITALSVLTSFQGVIWFTIFEHKKLSADEYLREVIEMMIRSFTCKQEK
ncbi:MAG: TetR/AcrR family transcriptional regulator [Candidatus Marinimicrobia bacterium]|nr:TetR/AcrR family transcriptional regulator [Candidatus Neomarinimicrobiota bacterium]